MKFIFMFAVICVVVFPQGINGGVVNEIVDSLNAGIEEEYCREQFSDPFGISLCKFIHAGARKLGVEPQVFLIICLILALIMITFIFKCLCCSRKRQIIVYTAQMPPYKQMA